MINQLRLYEIFDESQEEFLDRFRDHAARIMARHGFRILAMWTTRYKERPAFAYLLSWRDAAEMKAAWVSFMADQEWIDIKAQRGTDAGPIVGEISDLALAPVPFSAALS